MKTSLKILALFTSVAVPTAVAIESVGVNLPPSVGVWNVFGLFVASLIILTAVSDYTRAARYSTIGRGR
jgi:carbon starvation protein CstA